MSSWAIEPPNSKKYQQKSLGPPCQNQQPASSASFLVGWFPSLQVKGKSAISIHVFHCSSSMIYPPLKPPQKIQLRVPRETRAEPRRLARPDRRTREMDPAQRVRALPPGCQAPDQNLLSPWRTRRWETRRVGPHWLSPVPMADFWFLLPNECWATFWQSLRLMICQGVLNRC